MESREEININLDDINLNNNEELEEFVLFEENVNRNKEEQIENSGSELEMISDEEFLLECARYGDFDDLIQLLKDNSNLNLNYYDTNKNSALHMASANGHFQIVKFLINDYKSELNNQNSAGNTPLHWAAMNGQKDIVHFLVDKGADVMILNNSQKLPSQEAYEKNLYDISEFLVGKEVAFCKDDFVEGAINKNDPDDFIDLNVDMDNLDKDN